jgi:hypothetical protein
MTGFVFTFSLLCTAALQADPAVLQRPESGILRPFIEAALPAVQTSIPIRVQRYRIVPVCGTEATRLVFPTILRHANTISAIRPVTQAGGSRAHPIRGPTVRAHACPHMFVLPIS